MDWETLVNKVELEGWGEKELVDLYVKGEITDVDVCKLASQGFIKLRVAGAILGKPPAAASRYCRKLLSELEEEEEEPPKPPKGAAKAARQKMDEVVQKIYATTIAEASTMHDYFYQLGREIHTLAYYYAAKDPRYSEALKIDPRGTIRRFLEDTMSFYIAWQDIIADMKMTIDRLMYIISKYDSLVRTLLQFTLPAVRYKMEAQYALILIDRMILAKLLGAKIPKNVAKAGFSLLKEIEDEILNEEIRRMLGGVSHE